MYASHSTVTSLVFPVLGRARANLLVLFSVRSGDRRRRCYTCWVSSCSVLWIDRQAVRVWTASVLRRTRHAHPSTTISHSLCVRPAAGLNDRGSMLTSWCWTFLGHVNDAPLHQQGRRKDIVGWMAICLPTCGCWNLFSWYFQTVSTELRQLTFILLCDIITCLLNIWMSSSHITVVFQSLYSLICV